jgi:YD repeat-containing protein
MKRIVVVLALLLPAPAHAQQQTLYGPDGRVIGRSVTDSQGTTTHYDAAGRRIGSSTTGRDGTVTVYGADGRRVGTSTTTGPKR